MTTTTMTLTIRDGWYRQDVGGGFARPTCVRPPTRSAVRRELLRRVAAGRLRWVAPAAPRRKE